MARTRMFLAALVGLALMTSQPRPAAQETLLPKLQVGTHVYFPDGNSVARWHRFDGAGTPNTVLEMYTVETLCVFNSDPKRHGSGYGWELTVTPVKDAGGTLVVHVDWKRSRDRGQMTETPRGSVDLALTPGKSVPLDYIVPVSSDKAARPCAAIGMLLQVDLRR